MNGNTTDDVIFSTAATKMQVIVARRKKPARLELKCLNRSMFKLLQIPVLLSLETMENFDYLSYNVCD